MSNAAPVVLLSTAAESAAAMLLRVKASPLTTGIEALDKAMGGGLKGGEGLAFVASPACGKTEWLHWLAARHLCRGGCVCWVTGLSAPTFDLHRFLCVLESVFCAQLASESTNGGGGYTAVVEAFGGAAAFQQALLQLADGIAVAHCPSALSLLVTLANPAFPPVPKRLHPSDCPTTGGSGAAAAPVPVVPLLVVDGLGLGCGTAVWEKQCLASLPLRTALRAAVLGCHCAFAAALTVWPHDPARIVQAPASDAWAALTAGGWAACLPAELLRAVFYLAPPAAAVPALRCDGGHSPAASTTLLPRRSLYFLAPPRPPPRCPVMRSVGGTPESNQAAPDDLSMQHLAVFAVQADGIALLEVARPATTLSGVFP